MQMAGRFHMNGNNIGARLEKGFDVSIRVRNHQMDVEGQFGDFSQIGDNGWSHGNVGHKIAVHHIHVDPVGSGFFHGDDFLAQFAAVRGKN